MNALRILVADDHKIIRDGIRAMLEEQEGWEIVAEAENGKQAVEICKKESIDFVLMDITMSEMDGIEATRAIREEFPELPVLALSMLQEDEHIRRMIEAGASGYVLKSSGSEELVEAMETVLGGSYYFSEEATDAIMKDLVESGGKKSAVVGPESLTEREVEVLELICQEMTNQEIADELFISVRTVDAHRRNLLQKTGARNTAGLVKYALKNGLIN